MESFCKHPGNSRSTALARQTTTSWKSMQAACTTCRGLILFATNKRLHEQSSTRYLTSKNLRSECIASSQDANRRDRPCASQAHLPEETQQGVHHHCFRSPQASECQSVEPSAQQDVCAVQLGVTRRCAVQAILWCHLQFNSSTNDSQNSVSGLFRGMLRF